MPITMEEEMDAGAAGEALSRGSRTVRSIGFGNEQAAEAPAAHG
jgi:hypothetical protein